MSDFVKGLLQERRKRTVATVMGTLERSPAWKRLNDDERKDVRAGVFGGVNSYHELALDVLSVLSDDHVMINEQALVMIRDLHDDLQG